ncbi:hypothetical protein [Phaeovulum sp.]
MTNKIALGIGLLIVAFFLIDFVFYGWNASLFIAKKIFDLVDYVAFWR